MARPIGYKIAVALSTFVQTTMSLIVPAGIFIFGAIFLVDKFSFPEYTKPIGVVLGVVAGFYSMFKYIFSVVKITNRDED